MEIAKLLFVDTGVTKFLYDDRSTYSLKLFWLSIAKLQSFWNVNKKLLNLVKTKIIECIECI